MPASISPSVSRSADRRVVSSRTTSSSGRLWASPRAKGNTGYSSATWAIIRATLFSSWSRPASVISYVVRSGRLPSRSVPTTATRPLSANRRTAW